MLAPHPTAFAERQGSPIEVREQKRSGHRPRRRYPGSHPALVCRGELNRRRLAEVEAVENDPSNADAHGTPGARVARVRRIAVAPGPSSSARGGPVRWKSARKVAGRRTNSPPSRKREGCAKCIRAGRGRGKGRRNHANRRPFPCSVREETADGDQAVRGLDALSGRVRVGFFGQKCSSTVPRLQSPMPGPVTSHGRRRVASTRTSSLEQLFGRFGLHAGTLIESKRSLAKLAIRSRFGPLIELRAALATHFWKVEAKSASFHTAITADGSSNGARPDRRARQSS